MKTVKNLFLTLILASLALTNAQAANSDTDPVSLATIQEEQEAVETKNQSFWDRHRETIIIAASALTGAGLMWLIFKYGLGNSNSGNTPTPPPPPPLPLRDEWNLPNFFTGKRAQHLRPVLQNDGWSCGYHALSNAAAIEELAKAGGELTAEKIRQTSEKYFAQIKPNQPAWLELASLASISDVKLGMADSVYLVGLDHENRMVITKQNILGDPVNWSQDTLPNFMKFRHDELHENDARAQHYIYHRDGNHWSLISIVKPLAQQPRMIITDSMKASAFSPQDSLMPIAQSLYENLIG